MVMLTSTQTVRIGQCIKAVYARANGRYVKILDIRSVYDIDPAKSYLLADVQTVGGFVPHGVPLDQLRNIYAIVEQVIE